MPDHTLETLRIFLGCPFSMRIRSVRSNNGVVTPHGCKLRRGGLEFRHLGLVEVRPRPSVSADDRPDNPPHIAGVNVDAARSCSTALVK